LQQIAQGLPFLSFVADNSSAADPGGWYQASLQALQACREAEEQLQAAVGVDLRTWQDSHSTKAGMVAGWKLKVAMLWKPYCCGWELQKAQ
jgi:hypothetical protein